MSDKIAKFSVFLQNKYVQSFVKRKHLWKHLNKNDAAKLGSKIEFSCLGFDLSEMLN